MVQSNIYKEAVDIFGVDNQLIVTMGEMAECSAEIAKKFISNREEDEQAIIDELADVVIMTNQCKVIYGERLISAINRKLKKVRAHIDTEKERQNGR